MPRKAFPPRFVSCPASTRPRQAVILRAAPFADRRTYVTLRHHHHRPLSTVEERRLSAAIKNGGPQASSLVFAS